MIVLQLWQRTQCEPEPCVCNVCAYTYMIGPGFFSMLCTVSWKETNFFDCYCTCIFVIILLWTLNFIWIISYFLYLYLHVHCIMVQKCICHLFFFSPWSYDCHIICCFVVDLLLFLLETRRPVPNPQPQTRYDNMRFSESILLLIVIFKSFNRYILNRAANQ